MTRKVCMICCILIRRGSRKRAGARMLGQRQAVHPLDYNTCSLEEIERHIGAAVRHTPEKSVLFLWTIDKYLFEAQQIAENLGYKLHARMIWNKVTGIPAAFTVRFGHEYLLYMYRGGLHRLLQKKEGKYIRFSRNRSRNTAKSLRSHTKSSSGCIRT